MSSAAAKTRVELRDGAVIAPSVAASWLPFGDEDAMRWLYACGLVHTILVPKPDGNVREIEVVTWREVLDEIEGRRQRPATPAKKPPAGKALAWSDPRS